MKNPLVTACLISYNRPEYIMDSVNSVINQTYKNLEIIIVDDCSNNEELIKVLDGLEELDERITVIRLDKNLGYPGPIGVGLRMAKGKYFTYIDDDDPLPLDSIEIRVNAFEDSDDEELGMVYGHAYNFKEDMKPKGLDKRKDIGLGINAYKAMFRVDEIHALTVMVKTECLRRVGGIDNESGLNGDWDFKLRMVEQYNALFVPQIMVNYRLHKKQTSKIGQADGTMKRTAEIVRKKARRRVEENKVKWLKFHPHVLVTGAGGFIGSHLCNYLAKQGANVFALVEYNSENNTRCLKFNEHSDQTQVAFGDINDADFIRNYIKLIKPNYIFHLAALNSVPYSFVAAKSFIETNILGTLNILNAIKGFEGEEKPKLVYTSTSEVFGDQENLPIYEDAPFSPQSPYAASKAAAELLINSYKKTYGLNTVIVRSFNVFGPRQSNRAVIPSVIYQNLFNEVIHLGEISKERDFNYVENVVEQLYLLRFETKTTHICYGKAHSVQDVIDELGIIKRIKKTAKRVRPIESEINVLLGGSYHNRFENTVSFSEGLKKTEEWIRNNKDFYCEEDIGGAI